MRFTTLPTSIAIFLLAAACTPSTATPISVNVDGGIVDDKNALNWSLRWEGLRSSCNRSKVEFTQNSAQNLSMIVDDELRGAAGCVVSGTLVVPGNVHLSDLRQTVLAAVATEVTSVDGFGQLRYAATLGGVQVGAINSRIHGERHLSVSNSLAGLNARFCRGVAVRLPFRVQMSVTSERRDTLPRLSVADWTLWTVSRCN